MCTINEDHMIYDSWDIRHDGQFLLHFGSFDPPNNPKNQNFEEMKKAPADTILHLRITYDDMIYGSWDIEGDRRNFLSFWTIFCPLTPLITQKIKILKTWKKWKNIFKNFQKMKKSLKISLFYTSVPKIMIICYTWDMVRDRCYRYFSFWAIFCPFTAPPPALTAKKSR